MTNVGRWMTNGSRSPLIEPKCVLLTNGDLMGGASTSEFPSESLLKIVTNSSPCSTFTYEARLS
jgi:hypothetical protein